MFCASEFACPFSFVRLGRLTRLVFCLAGAVTAIMTNPIWVVKVRMFTTKAKDPTAYRSLWRKFAVRSYDVCREAVLSAVL